MEQMHFISDAMILLLILLMILLKYQQTMIYIYLNSFSIEMGCEFSFLHLYKQASLKFKPAASIAISGKLFLSVTFPKTRRCHPIEEDTFISHLSLFILEKYRQLAKQIERTKSH